MVTGIVRIASGTGHRYETTGGLPVPGVTTVIGDSLAKPALVPWAANTTAGYAIDHWDELAALPPSQRLERIKKEWRGVRDRGAARGTEVHAYGEAMAHGQAVDVPAELMPYVEPYARFLDQWQIVPTLVERVICNESPAYAGTFDLIADLEGQGRWLLDIKTAKSGVWPETCLQLAAYRFADAYMNEGRLVPMLEVERAAAIWLPGDGTYSLLPICTDIRTYDAFCHLVAVAAWVHRSRRDLIGRALTPPVRLVEEESE